MKVAIVANTSWYVFNFRLNLMRALRDAGYTTVVIAPPDDFSHKLAEQGFEYRSVPLEAVSVEPLREIRAVVALTGALRDVDVALSYTPKGNLYTALACRVHRIRQIANVSGLGRTFDESSSLTRLMSLLYKFSFREIERVVFQNDDDRTYFLRKGFVLESRADRVPGSGVDLSRFLPLTKEPTGPITFLLMARMLWTKGIAQFADAAATVKARHPEVRFQLLGPTDAHRNSVPLATLRSWHDAGLIEYLGFCEDVRPCVKAAHCIVLPSFYREGVPRSLLEAASMQKPIIATDSVGCRDAVDDEVSGYLCAPRDSQDLARKMMRFLALSSLQRLHMGRMGREKMERQFDERIVVGHYLGLIRRLTSDVRGRS